jgi:hypothetical protein
MWPVNFFQRLLRRLRNALRAAPEVNLRPGPVIVAPLTSVDQLVDDARRQGHSHAELYDPWTFGVPGDGPDEVIEPAEVQRIRRRGWTAVYQFRANQQLASARLGDIPVRVEELNQMMAAARQLMAHSAIHHVQSAQVALSLAVLRAETRARAEDEWNDLEERGLVPSNPTNRAVERGQFIREQVREAVQLYQLAPPPPPDHLRELWEGPNPPLSGGWRTILLLFLAVIELPLSYVVARHYTDPGTYQLWAALLAVGLVSVPYALGAMFRAREGSGFDRVLRPLVLVLTACVLGLDVTFGLLAASQLTADTALTGPALVSLTPWTLRIVVVTLGLLPPVMAFLLGLARRHPYQEAYVRHQRERDALLERAAFLGTQINNAYLGLGRDAAGQDQERAISEAYLAAEEAYFSGLTEAIADPPFTEAVARRQGRRFVASPLGSELPPEPDDPDAALPEPGAEDGPPW